MKIFILLLVTFVNGSAESSVQKSTEIIADKYYGNKELVEFVEEMTSGPKEAGIWNQYIVDNCLMYNKSNINESELRDNGLRRCRDNSISFVQPKSRGVRGWEGKCGQTFAANSLFSICSISVDPATYFKKYLNDITPGVRPGTLRRGMNKAFLKNSRNCPGGKINRWNYVKLGSIANFISKTKKYIIPNYSHPNLVEINRGGIKYLRNPIGVLIQNLSLIHI